MASHGLRTIARVKISITLRRSLSIEPNGLQALGLSPVFSLSGPHRNNGKIRRLAALSGNMPPMDVAGVIWITVFGIVIGAAALAGGIFICRFIYALIKGAPTDD